MTDSTPQSRASSRLGGSAAANHPLPPGQRDPVEGPLAGAAIVADKYDQMLALADLFDASGQDMRERAKLGQEILKDDAVVDSGPLSPATWDEAEEDILAATTGKSGLLTRSVELDADALVVRATVLTYRWIDELQQVAYKTLGSIAGRAIGYLAPEVDLGGTIIAAGLIETDSLDREDIAAYLGELAETNPELMEHISGGGGLVEGLQMRSLLTAGVLGGHNSEEIARGGLARVGQSGFSVDATSALRDVAGSLTEGLPDVASAITPDGTQAPRSIEDLMTHLRRTDRRITLQRVGTGRYIAYLPGGQPQPGRLRVVAADCKTTVPQAIKAIEDAIAEIGADDPECRVMLVGSAHGGAVAAEIAAAAYASEKFVVDQVITAGSPKAQVPRIPEPTRMLSLEDRADPIALLGSLINAGVRNQITVVFDNTPGDEDVYVRGGRAADSAKHPELRAEIQRIHDLGFLVSA